MFIRQTTTRRKKDGESFQTYRLVESVRVGNKVKQRTLLHLSADFPIARAQWPELTDRIVSILHHQHSLLPVDKTIEAQAQRMAAEIISKNREYSPTDAQASAADYLSIDVDSIQNSRLRSIGVEQMAYDALQSLHLDRKLSALGFNNAEVAASIGTIIGRMAAPGSERATHSWLQRESGLGELIGHDFSQCSLTRMYRVSDRLMEHREALEAHLFERERTLFNLDSTITLYDLTNTFFEGSGQANDLAARGRSKEKRSDCPLVTLGLVLDGSGFPRSSKVFSGNASEPATLQEMVDSLTGTETNPLIVMDAGIATEANLAWLKERQWRYLVVSRKRSLAWDEERSYLVRHHGSNEVRIYKQDNETSGETELYCRSSSRAAKEEAIDTLFAQRFEEQMRMLSDGLSKKGCIKHYAKVWQRIGRLREKYSRVAQYYDIQVTKAEKGGNAVNLSFERIDDTTKKHAGVYCLRTNIPDWDAEKLWQTYIMLTDLEAVFRSMKSELGMRPVYHQTTERVEGHLWITLLAYHLVHYIRMRLKMHGYHDSWDSLRKRMHTHMRLTTSMRTKQGKTLHIRKAARPEPWQQDIYQMLDLPHNPGGTSKTVIEDTG